MNQKPIESNDTHPVLDVRNLLIAVRTEGENGELIDKTIVHGVDFTLERGKVLGLIGESGAGKSTIGLASMAYGRGACRIIGGEVLLTGDNILTYGSEAIRKLRGQRVTYVAQSAAAAFNPSIRLADQVIESALNHGMMSRDEALEYAVKLFTELQLPDPQNFGKRFPHQVSGGQLQRAMTAMALCPKPDLIVFDEPTTALDVTTQLEVLASMKRAIAHAGAAALYITHDLAVVAQMADDILVLRHGKAVEYGSTEQIIHAPREKYTKELVSVRAKVNPVRSASRGETVLQIENVDAAYGGNLLKVLHDVSMQLDKGRTLAIVGESGSGKSTLARVVTGLLPPIKGKVLFQGQALTGDLASRNKNIRRRLQMIYQMADTAINPRHTVRRIIGRPLKFYFGLRGKALDDRVRDLLRLIELNDSFLDRYPAELSGGQKQRICIARALAAQPDLIICDEVTSALDPLVAEDILRLLKTLQDDTGVAFLFITHDIETVRAIADDVAVMHHGRVVRFGPKDKVLMPPMDDYTRELLASVPTIEIGWLEAAIQRKMGVDATPTGTTADL
ncbi:ABC transporter ATP-binding protein [Celeribacter halophilus]|uniref:ABC transporter ATP-binding protein n=1 Tax=Celeribacter halophilus TaxID=576117 RepID=UPI001C09EE12|nr:ABC transporter ATP-binding protein [Celeribacter halophilus]MBU2888128.1 ABC transporter ATP-binding protein [Celeribacter halophilus]MDO6511874.1 ABC transporter ATP-binding protein [Celeribacter halophilus]